MNDSHELERHLTTEELLDYIERRIASDEIGRVEGHLASGCAICQEEMAWLTRTLDLMVPNLWLDAPSRLQASVRQSYRERFLSESEPFSIGRWLQSLFTPARPLAYAAVGIVLIVIIVGLLLQPWSSSDQEASAQIAAYSGTVEVQSADSDAWQPANDASTVSAGDDVRTGDESSVVLNFPDQSKTLMAPYTELSVLKMSTVEEQGDQVIILQQRLGKTQNYVQPLPTSGSRFEIRTPVATVSVRGTSFTVDVKDNGTTHVAVSEGRVQVAAQGVTVTLDAGEGTTVESGKTPGEVEQVPTVPIPTELVPPTPNPVAVPSDEPVDRRVATVTAAPSATPTTRPSVTPSPSPRPSLTPSASATLATETPTASPTSGSGISQPPEPTPTPTNTPVTPAPTETAGVPPPTNTPVVPPTSTPTATPRVPPGLTKTPEPPGQTRMPPGQSSNANQK